MIDSQCVMLIDSQCAMLIDSQCAMLIDSQDWDLWGQFGDSLAGTR